MGCHSLADRVSSESGWLDSIRRQHSRCGVLYSEDAQLHRTWILEKSGICFITDTFSEPEEIEEGCKFVEGDRVRQPNDQNECEMSYYNDCSADTFSEPEAIEEGRKYGKGHRVRRSKRPK